MSYHIAVCVKPVPDPQHYDKITINPVTKTITREGIPTIINPGDKHALEAALQVREKYGGRVTVIAMAPPNGVENLREALAMGADEAILLSDRAFAGADTLATSYTLAQGLKKAGDFDLIFTGTESADGATSQVPAQLARWLEMAHLWNVREFTINECGEINAHIKIENGSIEYLIKMPALLAVSRELNKPRYTSIMGVMKAGKKPLVVYGMSDLDADPAMIGLKGSPTQAGAVYTPSLGRKGQLVAGAPEEIAAVLVDRIRAAGITV